MKIFCSYLSLVCCLFFISSCASSYRKNTNRDYVLEKKWEIEAQFKSDKSAYWNCMEGAANYYISSTATPNDIADAAQSKCSSEFNALGRSTLDYFISVVDRSGSSMAIQTAQETTQEVKEILRKRVVQLVVEYRLNNR